MHKSFWYGAHSAVRSWNRVRLVIGLGTALLAAGCHGLGPEKYSRDIQAPHDTPVELKETPFFPQQAYQCGPAALATVLAVSGITVTPNELASKVYLPARKGSLQVELVAAARRYGRLPYPINPAPAALLGELRAGRPVLVLQNLGFDAYPIWHYAVVIGFDSSRDEFILRSGTRERETMSTSRFLYTWEKGSAWGLVVLPPGEMPVDPDPDTYLEAVVALETAGKPEAAAQAYAAGLERWPENAKLRLGLGNAYYAQGRLAEAEAVFRELVARYPEHAVGYNNLAQALVEQGCYDEGLQAIEAAIVSAGNPDNELRAAFERTRRGILRDRDTAGKMNHECSKLNSRVQGV
jgi:tetratricopeptide (TPR) repeat protein